MSCNDARVVEVRENIRHIVEDHLDRDDRAQRRIDEVWRVMIVAIALCSLVLAGLIIHVAGDFIRFEDLQRDVAELKIKLSGEESHQYYHSEILKKEK